MAPTVREINSRVSIRLHNQCESIVYQMHEVVKAKVTVSDVDILIICVMLLTGIPLLFTESVTSASSVA